MTDSSAGFKLELTPVASKWLALALAGVVITVIALVIILPVRALHRHYDDSIEDSLDKLARYGRVAAMRPALDESVALVNRRDANQFYWRGNTPALVASDMQAAVTSMIENANNAKIFSSQTMSSAEDAKQVGPTKIGISFQIAAPIVPLQLVLYGIEKHQPYLFIESMNIRANQGRAYKPAPGVQPEYTVQFTVRGYSNSGSSKP